MYRSSEGTVILLLLEEEEGEEGSITVDQDIETYIVVGDGSWRVKVK